MGGVEVAVREPIAHSGDISPGDLRLGREETLREVFDGLADLDEAHPHGVEHESVIESTTIEVRPDRQDRGSEFAITLSDPETPAALLETLRRRAEGRRA